MLHVLATNTTLTKAHRSRFQRWYLCPSERPIFCDQSKSAIKMTGRRRWSEFNYVAACRMQKLVIRDFLENLHLDPSSHAGEHLICYELVSQR